MPVLLTNSNKMKFLFRIALTLFFIFIILYKIDIKLVISNMSSISPIIILFTVLINIITVVDNSIKWNCLLLKHPLMDLFKLNMIGQFFSLVLPGQLMGDASKTYIFAKGNPRAEKIATSVIVDKITGLIAVMLSGIIGMIFTHTKLPMVFIIISLTIMLSLVMGLFIIRMDFIFNKIIFTFNKIGKRKNYKFKKISEQFERVIIAWHEYAHNPQQIFSSILIGILYQFMGCIILMLLSHNLHINIVFFDWCWIIMVMSIALLLPLTMAGIGVRDGTLIGLLGFLKISPDKALSLSFSLLEIQLITAIIGGIIYLNYKSRPQ